MEPGYRSPLVDVFRRGEAARDIRMLAAAGAIAPRAHEQLALLVMLSDDEDKEVAAKANATIARLPSEPLAAFLARSDVPEETRRFFVERGLEPASEPLSDASEPLLDLLGDLPELPEAQDAEEEARVVSALPIADRLKFAMKGTREQRAQLIRDSNRIVAVAVLSSPKLTDSEIETFARMANVAEEVLRIIGTNRSWLKNYSVLLALTRNPKTPPAISMQLMHRLGDRDVKMLAIDRNVPEALRLAARRIMVKSLK
jgi:hypothetical protein